MELHTRILVTGGSGFLGQHLLAELKRQGYTNVYAPTHSRYRLTDRSAVGSLFFNERPQAVIHLAAQVGGIGANQKTPGEFFYANALMGMHMMEVARLYEVEKYIQIGTVCSYPKFCETPFKEWDIWNGYPEETNASYGLAKRMLIQQAIAYKQQYGFNAMTLIPSNLYGPGDNFDLNTGHVIPAIIRKVDDCIDNHKQLELWGNGLVSREFLYVTEAARAIVLAMESNATYDVLNIGSGKEIYIRELAEIIMSQMGMGGVIKWDESKPNGQPRRVVCTAKARDVIGFSNEISLLEGITKTVRWWRQHGKLQYNSSVASVGRGRS